MARITVIEDDLWMRYGLSTLLRQCGHQVTLEVGNGQQFINRHDPGDAPQIVVLNGSMASTAGDTTVNWIRTHLPDAHILAFINGEEEHALLRLVRSGVKGFLRQNCGPEELKKAIDNLLMKGCHHSDTITTPMPDNLDDRYSSTVDVTLCLTERERTFLALSCSEMSYKEIARKMFVSPRTVDGYRDQLHEKFHLRTRVGLAMFAIRHGIVKM